MGQPISIARRNEIVSNIRDNGLSVTDASHNYQVSTKTIYRWLKENVSDISTLEVNRLRRENEQLYTIIGKITAELKRSKK